MLRLALVFAMLALPADAQDRRPSHCFAIADAAPELTFIHKASWTQPTRDDFSVRLSYIDHSMYLIQSHAGVDIVTDYNGFIGAVGLVPDVVTMNNAHGTHWTSAPHPDIPQVLPGWRQEGEPAEYYLEVDDVLIRNVTTDIRGGFGGARIEDSNSIFVFEIAGLCIGHLGHLHHEPSDETYAALGRLDVVMAAVDGGMTVDIPTMTRIIRRLKSSVVLPMHWFSSASLNRFLDGISDEFDIDRRSESHMELSLRDLPSRPTIVVLQPRFLSDE